jgi:hypothetical protein
MTGMLVGCTSRPEYPTFDVTPYQQLTLRAADRYEAAPLFDARPGYYSAEDFNYRNDWPSTTAYYSGGQVTEYRLYQIDHYGHGFGDYDHIHRWAQIRRYERSYR